MNDKIVCKNIQELEWKQKHEHDSYQYNKSEITKREDFREAYVCVYEILPLKSSFPKHYHTCNTECFYIISGNGRIDTKNSSFPITAGDILVFPSGEEGTHKITNTSDKEKLVYIDFDTTNSPDIVHYVDSGKIGIIKHNVSSTFYKENDSVEYFEGE
jgi:uncharacterized cupin superfamily protein